MDVRVGLWRKLSAEELMLLNCGVGEDSWVPWTARRSNQSIIKEISPEYSLGRTDVEAETLTLILWKIEGRRRRWWQRMRWLDGITDSMTWVWVGSGSWWWTGRPGVLQFMGSQSQTWLSDWTELNWIHPYYLDVIPQQMRSKTLTPTLKMKWDVSLLLNPLQHEHMT